MNAYETTVFAAPPWEEIFRNDDVRRASFEAYLEFHALLLSTYQDLGYMLDELPRLPVPDRVDYIRHVIGT